MFQSFRLWKTREGWQLWQSWGNEGNTATKANVRSGTELWNWNWHSKKSGEMKMHELTFYQGEFLGFDKFALAMLTFGDLGKGHTEYSLCKFSVNLKLF